MMEAIQELLEGQAWVDPGELGVASPFSDLFPIDPGLLEWMTSEMRQKGFDAGQPVIVWREKNLVVDGHTRRNAAIAAGKEVLVFFHSFPDEDAAFEYAVSNQRNRRNLKDSDIARLTLLIDNRDTHGGNRVNHCSATVSVKGPTGPLTNRSADETAKIVGTSPNKVKKVRAIKDHSPEVLKDVESGKTTINQAYTEAKKQRDKKRKKTSGSDKTRPKSKASSSSNGHDPYQSIPPDKNPWPIIERTTVEMEWLDQFPMRKRLAPDFRKAFDDDALLYRAIQAEINGLKASFDRVLGVRSTAKHSQLQVLVYSLMHLDPPGSWKVCPKCEGDATRTVTCKACRHRGFQINNV